MRPAAPLAVLAAFLAGLAPAGAQPAAQDPLAAARARIERAIPYDRVVPEPEVRRLVERLEGEALRALALREQRKDQDAVPLLTEELEKAYLAEFGSRRQVDWPLLTDWAGALLPTALTRLDLGALDKADLRARRRIENAVQRFHESAIDRQLAALRETLEKGDLAGAESELDSLYANARRIAGQFPSDSAPRFEPLIRNIEGLRRSVAAEKAKPRIGSDVPPAARKPEGWQAGVRRELGETFALAKEALGLPLSEEETGKRAERLTAQRLERKGALLRDALPDLLDELEREDPDSAELAEARRQLERLDQEPWAADRASAAVLDYLRSRSFDQEAKAEQARAARAAAAMDALRERKPELARELTASWEAIEELGRELEAAFRALAAGDRAAARPRLDAAGALHERAAGRRWTARMEALPAEFAGVWDRLREANARVLAGLGAEGLSPRETLALLERVLERTLEGDAPEDGEAAGRAAANAEALWEAGSELRALLERQEALREEAAGVLDALRGGLGDWLRAKGEAAAAEAFRELEAAKAVLQRIGMSRPAYARFQSLRRDLAAWIGERARDAWAVPMDDLMLEDYAAALGLPSGSYRMDTRLGDHATGVYGELLRGTPIGARGQQFVSPDGRTVVFRNDDGFLLKVVHDGQGGMDWLQQAVSEGPDGGLVFRRERDLIVRRQEAGRTAHDRTRLSEETGVVGEGGALETRHRWQLKAGEKVEEFLHGGKVWLARLPDGRDEAGSARLLAALNPDFDYASLPAGERERLAAMTGLDAAWVADAMRLRGVKNAAHAARGETRYAFVRDGKLRIDVEEGRFTLVTPGSGGALTVEEYDASLQEARDAAAGRLLPWAVARVRPDGKGGYAGSYKLLHRDRVGDDPYYYATRDVVSNRDRDGTLRLDFKLGSAFSKPEGIETESGMSDFAVQELDKNWLYGYLLMPAGRGLAWLGKTVVHGSAGLIAGGVAGTTQLLPGEGDASAWTAVRGRIQTATATGVASLKGPARTVSDALDAIVDHGQYKRVRAQLMQDALARLHKQGVAGEHWDLFVERFERETRGKDAEETDRLRFEALAPYMIQEASVEGWLKDLKEKGGAAAAGAWTIEVADFLGQAAVGAAALKPLSALGSKAGALAATTRVGQRLGKLAAMDLQASRYASWLGRAADWMRATAARVPGAQMAGITRDLSKLMTPAARTEQALARMIGAPVKAAFVADDATSAATAGIDFAQRPSWDKAYQAASKAVRTMILTLGSKADAERKAAKDPPPGGKAGRRGPDVFAEEGAPEAESRPAGLVGRAKYNYYKMLAARAFAANAIRSDPKLRRELGHLVEILDVKTPDGKAVSRDALDAPIRFESYPGEIADRAVASLLRRNPHATPDEIKAARSGAFGVLSFQYGPDGKVLRDAAGKPKAMIILNWGIAAVPIDKLQTLVHEAQHFSEWKNRTELHGTLEEEVRAHDAGATWAQGVRRWMEERAAKLDGRRGGPRGEELKNIVAQMDYETHLRRLVEAAKDPDRLREFVRGRYPENDDLSAQLEVLARQLQADQARADDPAADLERIVRTHLANRRRDLESTGMEGAELKRALAEEEAEVRAENPLEAHRLELEARVRGSRRLLLETETAARRTMRQPEAEPDWQQLGRDKARLEALLKQEESARRGIASVEQKLADPKLPEEARARLEAVAAKRRLEKEAARREYNELQGTRRGVGKAFEAYKKRLSKELSAALDRPRPAGGDAEWVDSNIVIGAGRLLVGRAHQGNVQQAAACLDALNRGGRLRVSGIALVEIKRNLERAAQEVSSAERTQAGIQMKALLKALEGGASEGPKGVGSGDWNAVAKALNDLGVGRKGHDAKSPSYAADVIGLTRAMLEGGSFRTADGGIFEPLRAAAGKDGPLQVKARPDGSLEVTVKGPDGRTVARGLVRPAEIVDAGLD